MEFDVQANVLSHWLAHLFQNDQMYNWTLYWFIYNIICSVHFPNASFSLFSQTHSGLWRCCHELFRRSHPGVFGPCRSGVRTHAGQFNFCVMFSLQFRSRLCETSGDGERKMERRFCFVFHANRVCNRARRSTRTSRIVWTRGPWRCWSKDQTNTHWRRSKTPWEMACVLSRTPSRMVRVWNRSFIVYL